MDPLMLFSALVLAVAAMHLISQSVKALRGKNSRHDVNRKINKRVDWYMFFRLSDLLGPQQDEPRKEDRATKTPVKQRRPELRLHQ